jgi:hemerythrin-like domain-containing protein
MTPIQQLQAEHRIIEKALRALTGLSGRLKRGESIQPDAFERLFEFLTAFADLRHHQKEEKCLFPALALHGIPRDHGPLGVMLQEHCSGRALIEHMKRAASSYAGHDRNAVRHFTEAAREYVELLTEHIHKEDNVLFRIAESLLDEHSMRSLQDEFEQAEAGFTEPHVRYEREAEEMEKAWTV